MSSTNPAPPFSIPARTTARVVALCWLAILSEGYDVGVMGAILPSLATDANWRLTPLQLGALGSYALFGMFFGGATIGTLSDRFGRKPLFLGCVALFSLSMLGAALAPTPSWFGLARFIGGLGLGGIIPIAAAYTIEFSPPERRGFNYGVMYSAYSIGILLAALVAIALVPNVGWRGVVWIGVVPLLFVPVLAWLLPRSNEVKGERAKAGGEVGTLPALFAGRTGLATVCFWIAIAMGLLLVYGLNTWLPQIMRKAGYDLGSSLLFLVVFSLASAVGGVVAGLGADRRGMKRITIGCYVLGALGIAALAFGGPLAVNYALVALAGLGSISASLILTAYIAAYYQAAVRATATGWALSAGRLGAMSGPLLGGFIASLGVSVAWNFYVFALVALIAAAATALVPEVVDAQ